MTGSDTIRRNRKWRHKDSRKWHHKGTGSNVTKPTGSDVRNGKGSDLGERMDELRWPERKQEVTSAKTGSDISRDRKWPKKVWEGWQEMMSQRDRKWCQKWDRKWSGGQEGWMKATWRETGSDISRDRKWRHREALPYLSRLPPSLIGGVHQPLCPGGN